MKQKEGSLIFIHTIIHRQHGIYSCCSFKEKTKGLFFSEIYPISPDRVLHFPCYHLEHEHLLEFDWNVMADLADLQADLMWYLPLKSEILCKQTKRLKKKLLKQVHTISWKMEKDFEAKPFKEVNFLPVSVFESLSQFP